MQLTTQINQELLQQAMQLTGLNTEKEVLENALHLLIEQTTKSQKNKVSLAKKNGILIIRSQEKIEEASHDTFS